MSSPVFEAVRTALAVGEYQDRDIPDDVVDRIGEAGHLTASSINQQPWHFVVVRDRQGLQSMVLTPRARGWSKSPGPGASRPAIRFA